MSLPFGLGAWYPLTHGCLGGAHVLGQELPASADDVRASWERCAPGQALVLVDSGHAPLARELAQRCGRRSLAARLAPELAPQGRVTRWRVLPGTGGSHVLLPAQRGGLEAGLPLLPAGRRRWRLARRLLQASERLGLGDRMGFGELLVAVKERPSAAPGCGWLASRPHAIAAISLGVPGLLRKATARICRPDGRVQGYLKLSLTGAARARVLHEADTLERLARMAPTSGLAPDLLERGETPGSAWLVQSPLPDRRSPQHLTDSHVAFLAELARRTPCSLAPAQLGSLRDARKHLDALRAQVEATWILAMEHLLQALSSELGEREVPCGLAHGDFTPWNLALAGPRLAAFDWEFADWSAPVLTDLVHFHLQTGILLRRAPAAVLLPELEAVVQGPARRLLLERGLCTTDALTFIGLQVLQAATADEYTHSIERPPFAQVQWLRRTRLELAQLIAKRLSLVGRRQRGSAQAA